MSTTRIQSLDSIVLHWLIYFLSLILSASHFLLLFNNNSGVFKPGKREAPLDVNNMKVHHMTWQYLYNSIMGLKANCMIVDSFAYMKEIFHLF